jgi:hypothetical protein
MVVFIEKGVGFIVASGSRAVLLRRVLATALVAVFFVGFRLAFHRHLGPYYVPWDGFEGGDSIGVFLAIAWTNRAIVILCIILFVARLVRVSRASEIISAPARYGAVIAYSILLGIFLFALWLPGRGDFADVIILGVVGALAVVFSAIILATTRLKRRYLVESSAALLLLFLGVGGLIFFLVLLGLLRD